MPYELRFAQGAIEELKALRANDRAAVTGQMERILTANPEMTSKARVKLLRQPAPAQYRLRVGGLRVFYDVGEDFVLVLRIMSKESVAKYLEERR